MKSPKISIFRGLLLASIAASGMTFAAPVVAQDEAAEAENDGAIVVTARRREENLLDVPIAVSAFSGESLEQRGALDLTDIGNITPNTTLETSRGSSRVMSYSRFASPIPS